jgi:CHAD domain-containing protein
MPKAAPRPTDPAVNAARVIASAVRHQWARSRDEMAKAVHQGGMARVHDLRVALRRLLSALELAEAIGAPAPDKVVRRLERALGSLSPLRDLEVERQTLDGMSEREPALADIALALEERRASLANALTKKLGRFQRGETERSLEHTASRLELETDSKQAVKQLVLGGVARRYAKFDQRRRAIADADHEALHRVRIAFKKYRYAVEVALPLLPPSAERCLAAMKHFQNELGAIQDASVLLHTLHRLARMRRSKTSKRRRALLALLKREQHQRVQVMLGALAAQVAADPPAFSEIFG